MHYQHQIHCAQTWCLRHLLGWPAHVDGGFSPPIHIPRYTSPGDSAPSITHQKLNLLQLCVILHTQVVFWFCYNFFLNSFGYFLLIHHKQFKQNVDEKSELLTRISCDFCQVEMNMYLLTPDGALTINQRNNCNQACLSEK